MTDIVVIRGLGDREAEDIIDILLSTDAVALSRGRAELDLRSSAQVERQITVPYQPGIELGQIVEVSDTLQGETYKGKLTGVDYNFDTSPSATMDLTLIVPTNFYV